MRAFVFPASIALAVATVLVGCATAVEQDSGPPGASASAAPSTSAPATTDGAYLLGGLDTDQPCTATLADAPKLDELGIALQEVAAMTLDPEELGLTGDAWWRTSEYTDNYQFESWRNWPGACERARQYGRVTGHMQRASANTPEETYTQMQVDAELFQTPAGADAWLTWFAEPSPSDSSASPPPTRTVEPLAGLGDRALLITRTDAESQGSIVILRRGRIVGDVYVWADAGEAPILDVREVARRLDERIASVEPTGAPVDIVATMTAPLPLTAWGEEFTGWIWDLAGYAGGSDNATFLESTSNPEQAKALVQDYGRLGGYQATFGAPNDPGWIATGTTTYPDTESAEGAMDVILDGKLTGAGDSASPAERFEVPGVEGSVGLVQVAGDELVTDVYFVRGPLLARTFSVRQPAEQSTDDRGLVSDMAERFAQRLDSAMAAAQ